MLVHSFTQLEHLWVILGWCSGGFHPQMTLFKVRRARTLRPRSYSEFRNFKREREKKSIELTELPSWRGFQRHSLVCGVFCWGPRSWPAVLINFWKLGPGFLSKRCHPATGASGNAGHWNSLGARSWCGWHPDAWGKKASKNGKGAKPGQKMGLARKPSVCWFARVKQGLRPSWSHNVWSILLSW